MSDLCKCCVRASIEWARRGLDQAKFSEDTKEHLQRLIGASGEWLGRTTHTCGKVDDPVVEEQETPGEAADSWADIMRIVDKSEHKITLYRSEGLWFLKYGDMERTSGGLRNLFSWLKGKIEKESS